MNGISGNTSGHRYGDLTDSCDNQEQEHRVMVNENEMFDAMSDDDKGAAYGQLVDGLAKHAMSDPRGVLVMAAAFALAVKFVAGLEGDQLAVFVSGLPEEDAIIVGVANRVAEIAGERRGN